MYKKLSNWLDTVLEQNIPKDVIAFGFNLYEDEDSQWSVELIGTGSFDTKDDDWCCDEITDFGTREDPFSWKQQANWDDILKEITDSLKKYLKYGRYADILKSKKGIGVGFVDGDLEIIT